MVSIKFLLGNEIIAISAANLGFQCATSYPGTPAVEILETMQKLGIEHAEWSVNEKVALEVAAGYAVSGVRSICSMKSVGLNVASDTLMTLPYVGVNAALVIVVADTPGCFSSQNEQDSRWHALASKIPVLEPASPDDCADSMSHAVRISEKLSLPVIIRLTTKVAHARESVDIKIRKPSKKKPIFSKDIPRFVMVPSNALPAHAKLAEKYDKAKKMLGIEVSGKGKTAVVCSGVSYANARDIIKEEKIICKLVRVPGLPFDEDELRRQIKSCRGVVVLEEGDRILENIVKKLHPKVMHKKNSYDELGNIGVRETLAQVFPIKTRLREQLEIPVREPRLCVACPHLMTFYWLKEAGMGPDNPDIVFPGDIGCYSLGYQQGFLDTLVSMGASIGMGQAMPGKKVIILGDSTFYHAGIPSLINAVQQKKDITVLILDNDSTAMTGHQPVPKLDLRALCESCGAKTVETDPFSRKTRDILKKAASSKGVNVVIMKRSCAIVGERTLKFVITGKCDDCGECDKINCPAIELAGSSHVINDLCWGCGFCAVVCPKSAIRREKK